MRIEDPHFSICAYNVGLRCETHPTDPLPSGAEENTWRVIRFCRQVDGCNTAVLVSSLKEAQEKLMELKARKTQTDNNVG